jgi:hypothetical protein
MLLVAAALMFSVAAYAVVRDFYGFSIDVPDGWSTNVDESEYSVSFTAQDGASFKIKHVSREGMDAFSFAQSAAFDMGGTTPERIGRVEYEFTLPDGTEARAMHIESWGILMLSNSGFESHMEMLNSWSYIPH